MNKLDCVFASNHYGNYAVPACTAKTEALAKTLLSGGVHEPETIQYILDNRRDGHVVHAGTYMGDFLPAISGIGHKVFAFEPGLEWYRCAKITLELNFPSINDHETELYNFGLGSKIDDTRKLLTMRSPGDGEGGASRIMQNPDGVEPFRLQDIQLAPLDLVLAGDDRKDVSVIQLDIEGYEEEALKGAVEILRASKPLLILEVANDTMLDTEFYNTVIFDELGYKQVDKVHGNYVFRSTK